MFCIRSRCTSFLGACRAGGLDLHGAGAVHSDSQVGCCFSCRVNAFARKARIGRQVDLGQCKFGGVWAGQVSAGIANDLSEVNQALPCKRTGEDDFDFLLGHDS